MKLSCLSFSQFEVQLPKVGLQIVKSNFWGHFFFFFCFVLNPSLLSQWLYSFCQQYKAKYERYKANYKHVRTCLSPDELNFRFLYFLGFLFRVQCLRFMFICWLRTSLQFMSCKFTYGAHHYMPSITNMTDIDFKKQLFFLPVVMKVYVTSMFCIHQRQTARWQTRSPTTRLACEHLFALFYKLAPFLKLTCR